MLPPLRYRILLTTGQGRLYSSSTEEGCRNQGRKARAASQDSDDDSMPELAPVSDSDDNEGDLHLHDAMAKALTTIPRSHHTSTASWSSGQDAIVPDTDIDELRSDAESEKEGMVVTEHKVSHLVFAL
jgi:hypothetical protein